jgi:vacuolar-type H+-ATPase subunit H
MIKKILIALGIVLVLLAGAAILIPMLYKDTIAAKAKDSLSQSVNAKVNFSGADLTIVRSFPNITFCMNDFLITGIREFEGDTLTYIKSLEVKLNLWDVIGGSQMKIRSVSLEKPFIHILTLKDGKANYDIIKEDTSSASPSTAGFKMELESYSASDARIVYDDQSLGFKMTLEKVSHSGKGDFTQDFFTLSTTTAAEKLNVWYGAIKYVSNAKALLTADMDIDMKKYKYTFRENQLLLNELPITVDGWVAMPDEDIDMDLKWAVRQSDFKYLVSLIPGAYTKEFKDLTSAGRIEMNGHVKGIYGENKIPAFGVTVKIDNGMFKYPTLPAAVNNVNVDLKVTNPDGVADHTVINLTKLHVELGSEPFDARLYVTTPVSDAAIDGALKGTVNLANIRNFIPQEPGTELNGIVNADVAMKGRYSSIEKKQYEKFDAAGTLSLSGMNYKSAGYPLTTINNLLLTFNPKNVTLNQLAAKVGRSDFNARGTIDNLIGYYLKDELLTGNFTLTSSVLDVNELMTGQATGPTPPDTSALTVLNVPSNIDFTMSSAIGKVYYDNLQVENLNGVIQIKEQVIDLSGLFFNMLNGSVAMSGTYSAKDIKNPSFSFDMALNNFDIQQSVKTFSTAKALAPVAEHCTGSYSTSMVISGKLNQHMQPVLNTLTGKGKLTSNRVQVSNFEPLNQLASALKMDQYKKLDIQDLNLSYEIKNGRVEVKPFSNFWQGASATVSGSSGIDQTIDYTINLAIPKSTIPASAQSALNAAFAKANAALGTNAALPDPVKVNVLVGGTIMKPTIKTDLSNQGQALAETAKEAVEQKVEETVEKGKEEARAQADKIMADAQKQSQQILDAAKVQADALKKQGYAAADSMVKKATNPIAKVAAQEAAKKAKQETDKQVQKILDDANKKSQQILADAKKQSDALLK